MSENTRHLQWYERFGGKKKIPDAGVTPGCQPLSHVLKSGFEQEMDRSAFAATKRHNPDKKGRQQQLELCDVRLELRSKYQTASHCYGSVSGPGSGSRPVTLSQPRVVVFFFPFIAWILPLFPCDTVPLWS